jgi:perosamine synthetase
MRMLRDHGMTKEKRYWHVELGFNYRMTNLQAAVGLAQTERADWILARKRQIAQRYAANLKDEPGLTPSPEASWAKSSFWMFSLLVDEREFGCSRDELMARLREAGVDSRRFFYPMHTMPAYQRDERHPVAEDLGQRGINLPSSVRISDADIDRVCAAIVRIGREARSLLGARASAR